MSMTPMSKTKYPLLAVVGIAALSLAACGTSSTGSPGPSTTGTPSTSTSPSAPNTPGAQGRDRVAGLIASVSGATVQVTQPSGTAAVAFSPSTTVSQLTPAQFTDVTPGSCVAVHPGTGGTPSGGTLTARSVLITAPVNGQCRPTHGRGAVSGSVSSVSGNTIVAATTDSSGNNSQSTIQVDNSTTYAKLGPANAQAISVGQCIAARGTTDSSGTLQATAINLRPANNGTCPQPGGHHPRPTA
ncbi:MAG TPA: DUF5666 domain-containing protein [Mycobacterium sp.]|nr:DUF5666 domain-containing protein [Mycobacterium sp.]